MRRLVSLLLVIGALLLLGVSTALGADDPGTAMDLGMVSGKPDDHGKATAQRLVDDVQLIETDVREPALPAERVLIQR
jgi:hypothetical protein